MIFSVDKYTFTKGSLLMYFGALVYILFNSEYKNHLFHMDNLTIIDTTQ